MNRDLRTRPRAALAAAALALLVLAAGACGGDDTGGPGAAPPSTAPPSTAPPSSAPPSVEEIVVDWTARTVSPATVDGWELAFCEGDGPLVCVSRDGRTVGLVELLRFDRSTLDGFDGSVEGMTAWAENHYRVIADDRAEGCDAGYRIEGDEPAAATVAGDRGIRYALSGFAGDDEAERTVTFAVERGEEVFLVSAAAYDPDGCVATEGSEFTSDALRDFEPVLAAMAAGSSLPAPRAAGDEAETATGFLTVEPSGRALLDAAEILTGPEATRAARDAGVIGPDEELDTDFFVDDRDDEVRELRVTDRTTVALYDCAEGCELRPVDTSAFLDGSAEPFGGDDAVFTVRLRGDEITAVEEQYLP